MKAKVCGEEVSVVDQVVFPELIRSVSDNAYLHGRADDAFYICDLGDIVNKHQVWLNKMPLVRPFYAVKCNPNPLVIMLLSKMGVGFDCASKAELNQVLSAGVNPDRIIYAHPCKQVSHIKYAESQGVKMMTFDSRPELLKIAEYFPSAKLILRIFVGATKARCPLGLKFGANLYDVPELLSLAKSIGLDVIGVSFHVGSGCFDASAYRTAIALAKDVFNIACSLGIHLTLLDIGGGFPGNLESLDNQRLFEEVCDTINSCINEYFSNIDDLQIIAEPGRYYVSSAFHLACTITSKRTGLEIVDSNHSEVQNYFLNDGLYGSFNCVVFDHYIGDHYLLNDYFSPDMSCVMNPSVLWGPTCDSADKIAEGISMRNVSVGERIVFKNMGAYTIAAGSNFNGFSSPYVVYYISYANWHIISPFVMDQVILTDAESELSQVVDDAIVVEAPEAYEYNSTI